MIAKLAAKMVQQCPTGFTHGVSDAAALGIFGIDQTKRNDPAASAF
ncbi:hypothetical protein [Novosphingobium sp. PhB55]|nr:hypothetical protein [Novosphingobium sp. PhB55]